MLFSYSFFCKLNNKKNEASKKIKNFVYSVNEAISTAYKQYGNITPALDSSEDTFIFVNTYIKPYISGSKAIIVSNKYGKNLTALKLNDGSIAYFVNDYCINIYYDMNAENPPNEEGRDKFNFNLCLNKNKCNIEKNKISGYNCSSTIKKNDRKTLYDTCKFFRSKCSLLIEYDNWEIKSDYPIKL